MNISYSGDIMNISDLKKLIKNSSLKVILVINDYKYSLKDILNEYSILELGSYDCDDIYYNHINSSVDILIVNIDIKYIDKLKEINKILKPDIIFIPRIENIYTKGIEDKLFKYIKKGLKKLKNKTLIINNNDKYLKKIYINNLDIYRYGNDIYDDINYTKEKNDIIIDYQDKKYTIKNKDNDIVGYIIIGLLFGIEIDNIVNSINNIEKKA